MMQLAADAGIAAVVLVPLWWFYGYTKVLNPGSGPQGQDVVLLMAIFYFLVMLGIAAAGSLRMMVVGHAPWPLRFVGLPLLPPAAVLLSIPLLWGILDFGMPRTGFLTRGIAAARSGAGVALLLWAVFAPWKLFPAAVDGAAAAS